MIKRLVIWSWRAWPVIIMLLLAFTHFCVIKQFPINTVFVNKLTGALMQIVGGLLVLHSVDNNLGLFRNHSLPTTIISWFRECPIFAKPAVVCVSGVAACTATGSASFSSKRVATTIEERVAEVERRIDELRSEVAAQNSAIRSKIEEVKNELATSIASNQSALNKLSEQVEKAAIGGFKQQAFGVLLVVYGAITSVFA